LDNVPNSDLSLLPTPTATNTPLGVTNPAWTLSFTYDAVGTACVKMRAAR
jgi:hypothetical protein